MDVLALIDRPRNWWKVFVLIFAVSIAVVGYLGVKTYQYAPPIARFADEQGAVLCEAADVTAGQQVFLRYGLMDYGSFLGDGGMRGPDFTAEALNLVARFMGEHYEEAWRTSLPDADLRALAVRARVQEELKRNRYDAASHRVTLGPAQAHAFRELERYYAQKFGDGGDLAGGEAFRPAGYISDPREAAQLSAFFFWGAWLCAAQRPGQEASYTHNWPYDPLAGNLPPGGIVFWSVIGCLVLVLALGAVMYLYGRIDRDAAFAAQQSAAPPLATVARLAGFRPTPSQRACYSFFALAAVLFLAQVLAGLLTIADFLEAFDRVGLSLRGWLPVTVARAWHSQVSILWIALCWFGATIFVLPMLSHPEPRGQLGWIRTLWWMLLAVAAGTVIGIPLGINGALGSAWRWLGLQGWEFVQMGRLWQWVLYAAFVLWLAIVVRGLLPALRLRRTWSLPNWIVYAIAGIVLMFSAGFVARPDTNFVIADFWRWCTIHMWVEAFFELFTTIIVAYFLYLMGFVSHLAASRVVYLAAVLFLGSGLVGISHNFYWNAKSIETVALGGVLSTLQVVPLVLLTIEAWRFRNLPRELAAGADPAQGGFALGDAFLFLIGVNFWNFFGAGVFGFSINLPIVNYYQHGTYLTVNHGHAALMGVYGNLAIAAMLFCGRWLVKPERWASRLPRLSFWSLNLGLALMVVLDLFPVGVDQLQTVMREGYAAARSQAYLAGETFQTFTWLRAVGVALFFGGGVLPIVVFVLARVRALQPAQPSSAPAPEPTVLAGGGARASLGAARSSGE